MVSLVYSPQELGLGRGELAVGQRALLVQRDQGLELGRDARALDRLLQRRRLHDHAVDRVGGLELEAHVDLARPDPGVIATAHTRLGRQSDVDAVGRVFSLLALGERQPRLIGAYAFSARVDNFCLLVSYMTLAAAGARTNERPVIVRFVCTAVV